MSILFELERMERLSADLNRLRHPLRIPVLNYKRKDGKAQGNEIESTEDWENCRIDEPWRETDSHRWYRTTIEIPEEMDKKHVEFFITTGREGQWDATNPQMLFYLNGKIVQGVDVNHREILITPCAAFGQNYDIAILAYSGTVSGDLMIRTELVQVEPRVEKAYYDFLVPLKSARLLKKADEENYRRILVKMGPAADALDLRVPYSKEFYDSLKRMEEILIREFYTNTDKSAAVVSAVGHTHIDIAWLWTVEQTREKVVRSFSTVLELMERYPDYRFMSSQPILYQFMKDQEPELYVMIKERVAEGRWETDGAMWLESDCNLPCGEAFVRQIMKGEAFFNSEFGVSSKCLWLPDVFGYSAALPQILKKCGIPYFLTTKIAWNQFNQLPNDTFLWKGIDGSRIFVFMPTTCDFDKTLGLNVSFTDTRNTTTYTGIVNPNMTLGTFKRFQNRDLTENTLMLFGFGDGGGGPTKEMLEEAERLKYGIPGIPRLVQEGERDFFDRIYGEISEKKEMPVWDGELYFEYHRGTLTSIGKNKRNNRKSEILYEQLETLGVMAELHGCRYPYDIIRNGWDTILLNQFHDIIPGSAVEAVYVQTDREYDQILKDGEETLRSLAEQIGGSLVRDQDRAVFASEDEEEISVIVFNTQGYIRDDVVIISGIRKKGIVFAKDGVGKRYPVQYTDKGELIFFAKGIPSVGYQIYRLCGEIKLQELNQVQGEKRIQKEEMAWEGSFENSWYKAQFNERMELTSLVEKETGFELIKEGRLGNQLCTYEDRPMNWDNWDLDLFYRRKSYEADSSTNAVLKEIGPVRTVVAIEHRFAQSVIEQEVIFYKDLPRIDFVTCADWKDHHVLLRVNFPVQINAVKASYEIQFGNLERETTSNHSWDTAKFEVCAHKWADLSENGLGISLLNDCKYGHSIKDGEMGLTLIKSGIYPNENADIGHHEFTYSIYPHQGRWQESETVEQAYNLNIPLVARRLMCNLGKPEKESWSMISIENKNCFMEMIKTAENGDGYILRIYENQNTRTIMKVKTGFDLDEVEECDLLERPIGRIRTEGRGFQDVIKPYEIKTYLLRFCIAPGKG